MSHRGTSLGYIGSERKIKVRKGLFRIPLLLFLKRRSESRQAPARHLLGLAPMIAMGHQPRIQKKWGHAGAIALVVAVFVACSCLFGSAHGAPDPPGGFPPVCAGMAAFFLGWVP